MIPKAPRLAQVLIVVFAIFVIAYGASIIRLDDESTGRRFAVPGELIRLQMKGAWTSLKSSDESVVKPISVAIRPVTSGYFLAMKPGRAAIEAIDDPCPITMAPPRCLAAMRAWAVEIDVGPG